jgi:hypothetical protein
LPCFFNEDPWLLDAARGLCFYNAFCSTFK